MFYDAAGSPPHNASPDWCHWFMHPQVTARDIKSGMWIFQETDV